MHEVFAPWHGSVYFYLCMEKRSIWEEVFGFSYTTNEEFEEDLGRQAMTKIKETF
jgi:spore photoproduct lyase